LWPKLLSIKTKISNSPPTICWAARWDATATNKANNPNSVMNDRQLN
jgi:hypothetical protein